MGSMQEVKKLYISDIECDVTFMPEAEMDDLDIKKWVEAVNILPNDIVTIPKEMFAGFVNLKRVEFGPNVQYIESSAFAGCLNLHYINLENILNIGDEAFFGCSNLKIVDFSSNKISIIGHNAFNNTGIEYLELPESLRKLGCGAFASNKDLRSVVIKEGLCIMSKMAFGNNQQLESISLPSSLIKIEQDAFRYCHDIDVDIDFSTAKDLLMAALGSHVEKKEKIIERPVRYRAKIAVATVDGKIETRQIEFDEVKLRDPEFITDDGFGEVCIYGTDAVVYRAKIQLRYLSIFLHDLYSIPTEIIDISDVSTYGTWTEDILTTWNS